ncbi:MAG: ABC transporter permease [Nitrospira sp.]|nr:ABC transporter permease [Nitrospira sp.]
MRRLAHFIREALVNIRLNWTTTVIAVATTAFTLACFGVFLLLYLNLRAVATSLQSDFKVVVYVQESVPAQGVAQLQSLLKADPGVQVVSYVSKEQALADFRAQFPADSHLLQGLGENPLPASFVVSLSPSLRSPDAVRRWAERVKSVPGVEQVQYSRDWIDNLTAIVGYLELVAVGIGTVLSAASATIIASTIRLTLYARREEIEIMRLIGATSSFIRIPYLIEGTMLGMMGSAVALAILKGGFELFKVRLGMPGRFLGIDSGVQFFSGQVVGLIAAAGLILGFIGSLVSALDLEKAK